MKEEAEIDVNIIQVYKAANMTLGDAPPTAEDNVLSYSIRLTNVGNGVDNFTLNTTGAPEDWNVTVSPTLVDRLGSKDTQPVSVTVTIPYNSSVRDATISLVSTSEHESLVSEFVIEVELSNLQAGAENLSVMGEEVSEGELNKETIPGFETVFMFAALIGVAIIMRRRRIL
jgi:uncharacterized membrane protein